MRTMQICIFNSSIILIHGLFKSQNDIDWNKQIQMNMNSQCACVFMITPMDIFDICIIPAIQQIMFMVYGATTNIYIFGEYKINHIVLMGLIMDITCAATYTQVQYLLKKCVENQNKYYNHITLHWIDDEIQKVLNKGIESIKANPAGGLLEQILTGTYYGMFDDQVYTDFNRLQLSTEKEFFHLIRKNTRVTEDMRENGITTLFYYNDSENTLSK
ncbi:hypothetical protein BDB01DRAFT_92405 [Pilobolus umbonatus]|nr:hypothetical protein BDB01DRAFT_92405 [Pilobolus umbonatus]